MKRITGMSLAPLFTTGLLALSLLFLQGCSSGRQGITIDSAPQGADVIADGKHIGTTPLLIKQDDVFPPHWYGGSYMVKGQLEIKKEGCQRAMMEVNDLMLSKDIKKELDCHPGMAQMHDVQKKSMPASIEMPVVEHASPKQSVPAMAPVSKNPDLSDDIESRLKRLKALKDKGVISEKEYSEQRKRILESL